MHSMKKYGSFACLMLALIGITSLWVYPRRGLNAVFYSNPDWKGAPAISQMVTQIDFAPIAQQADFPKRYFSAAWAGWIRIDRAGDYGFATKSDDGSSLFIDQEKIVENGGIHGARKVSATRFLTRGLHAIKILYLQGAGVYELDVSWTPPGSAETALPRDALYVQPFPVRGIGFLTRHRLFGVLLCCLLLLIILVKRGLEKRGGNITGLLKEYACNAAVSLLTIAFCLLMIEGGMRFIFWLRQDTRTLRDLTQAQSQDAASTIYRGLGDIIQPSSEPGIIYELRPHLKGTFLGASLETNAQGLRDSDYPYRKPDNTVRIVGLGDSSIFGWGVDMTETSLHLLEQRLNQQASGKRYDVINFAVPGYNTAIETEVFLKKCLKYDPDLVILHFNTNDYDIPNFMKRPQNYATLRMSFLFDFIYTRYQQRRGKHAEEALAPMVFGPLEETERLDESPAIPEEYRYMVGKRGFLAAMEKLLLALEKRQIPLLVLIIKPETGTDTFRGRQLALIRQLSQERSFGLLNTYPRYAEYLRQHPERSNEDFWISRTDTHPSALAHEIEAQAFYEFLTTHADFLPLL